MFSGEMTVSQSRRQLLPQRCPGLFAHLTDINIFTSDGVVPLIDLPLHLAEISIHAIRAPLINVADPRAALHEPLAAFFAHVVEC